MEHRKFGPGYQRDLQGVHEGDFAGLGKIGRMKNGFYFDCLKRVGLTHNLGSFSWSQGPMRQVSVYRRSLRGESQETYSQI